MHAIPPQSRSGVFGYALLVFVQFLAIIIVPVINLIYAGNHPDAIHALHAGAMILAFWGSPLLTLVGLLSKQLRSDPLGRRAALTSLVCTVIMYLAIAGTFLNYKASRFRADLHRPPIAGPGSPA